MYCTRKNIHVAATCSIKKQYNKIIYLYSKVNSVIIHFIMPIVTKCLLVSIIKSNLRPLTDLEDFNADSDLELK